MNFDFTEDQELVRSSLESLLARHPAQLHGEPAFWLAGEAIGNELAENGFMNLVRDADQPLLSAVLMIETVAKAPHAVEITASALIAPLISSTPMAGPIALTTQNTGAPIRFLPQARTLLVDAGDVIRVVDVTEEPVTMVASPYGYPLGRMNSATLTGGGAVLDDVDPERVRMLWRLGLAAEILGAMAAALELTTDYVRTRTQFGRPIGTFQVIQHRLSECLTLVESTRLLVRDAAARSDIAGAALAVGFAQEAAARLIYETHQFHGAIGLTLEYPLHFWTYKLRLLQGELGGVIGQGRCAAAQLWAPGRTIVEGFRS